MDYRIFSLPFTYIYSRYLAKIERTGRRTTELEAALTWLDTASSA
nr:DUF2200 family protein [Actinomyces sp.]